MQYPDLTNLKTETGDLVRLIELESTAHALLPERPKVIAEKVVNFVRDLQGTR